MEWLSYTLKSTIFGAINYAYVIFGISLICFIAELKRPASQSLTMHARLRALGFWIVYFILVAFFFSFYNRVVNLSEIKPLLMLKLRWFADSEYWTLRLLGSIAAGLASLAISDFFYYWFHRLQHRLSFFWNFHSIHHSIQELSVWNSYHHFTEDIFRLVFLFLPTALLIKTDLTSISIVFTILLGIQGPFAHTATRLNLGFLRYLIIDNRYHRLHHSIEKRHWNKNFSAMFPIWDILFGTAYFPRSGEWPATGLVGVGEAKTLVEYIGRPFCEF